MAEATAGGATTIHDLPDDYVEHIGERDRHQGKERRGAGWLEMAGVGEGHADLPHPPW